MLNKDEIISLAREAGIIPLNVECDPTYVQVIERFAALVAAHEREKQADISALPIIIEVAVKEAVIAEREACAKVCDEIKGWPTEKVIADECAAAIRARSR